LIKDVLEKTDMEADTRFNILFENIQKIEKKLDTDASAQNSMFSVPSLPKRSFLFGAAENRLKDEFKRTQKLKKEHRRTRIIRTIPEIDQNLVELANDNDTADFNRENCDPAESCMNVTATVCRNNSGVMSPAPSSPWDIDTGRTPEIDNPDKDPDWTKTPLVVKGRKRMSLRNKVN
jgi:hypothetical protein